MKKNQQKLIEDVGGALPFLFSEYGGRIVPTEGPPSRPGFDYASVTIVLEGLRLRFIRGREELAVSVSPAAFPTEWHDLGDILAAVSGAETTLSHSLNLWQVSRLLEKHLEEITKALSPAEYTPLRDRLETDIYAYRRNALREWEYELNRKIYAP